MGSHGHDLHAGRRVLTYGIVQGEAVRRWVEAHTNGQYDARGSVSIGLTKEATLIAGVVYQDWNRRSITCHIAFRGQLTRRYLGAIFRYPFTDCGVSKIIAPIYSDNLRMIRLARHMGFMLEATISDAQPLGDILIFTMTPNQCRFLGKRYG